MNKLGHEVSDSGLWQHSRSQVVDRFGVINALQKSFKTPSEFHKKLGETDEELLFTKYRIQQNYES